MNLEGKNLHHSRLPLLLTLTVIRAATGPRYLSVRKDVQIPSQLKHILITVSHVMGFLYHLRCFILGTYKLPLIRAHGTKRSPYHMPKTCCGSPLLQEGAKLLPVAYRLPHLPHKPAPPSFPHLIHSRQQHLLSTCCMPGMGRR